MLITSAGTPRAFTSSDSSLAKPCANEEFYQTSQSCTFIRLKVKVRVDLDQSIMTGLLSLHSNTHTTLLQLLLQKKIKHVQHTVCEMQCARSARTFYHIRSDCAVCEPACLLCFSGHWPTILCAVGNKSHTSRHIRHSVLHEYNQSRESANIWQVTDKMTSAAMTDDNTLKCKNSYVQLIYVYSRGLQPFSALRPLDR